MKQTTLGWRGTPALGLALSLASLLFASSTTAQTKPPTGAFPTGDAPVPPQSGPAPGPVAPAPGPVGPGAPGAVPGAPVAPASVPPSGAPSSGFTPPPAGPAPAPYGAPPPAYGGPPPSSGAPPPAYGAPPPYFPPESMEAPPRPGTGAAEQRGLYFGGRLGVGGPFGGDSSTGPGAGYSEGVGLLAEAGYAFIPYFGLNLFLHWNHTSLTVADRTGSSLKDNSGYVLLYGIEARGILPAGPFVGWASLGISLGTGSLTLTSSGDSFAGSVQSKDEATLDLKPTPVLGFGAEYEIVPGLFAGPELRWYLINASEACDKSSVTGLPVGFTVVPQSQCTKDFSKVTVPDVIFIGIGATYRLGLGS